MKGAWVWRLVSDEEWDFQLATNAFVDDLEGDDLWPFEIAVIEEFYGVDMSDLMTFDREWYPGKLPESVLV